MAEEMITVTGDLQFEAWRQKVLPPVEEVRPSVWSIPVPFPNNPMRYTLCYALIGEDAGSGSVVVVDPGWASAEGWEALTQGLAIAGVSTEAVSGIVVTHLHPDHLGLASRLRTASGAWVALGEQEVLPSGWAADADKHAIKDAERYRNWGVPADRLREVTFGAADWAQMARMQEPQLRLIDGAYVPAAGLRLRVIATPGHTPGHICLFDEKNNLLLTGDHILPRITPHISLEMHSPINPVADYLSSLDVLENLQRQDANTALEVLPAHEYRFDGLSQRLAELRQHTLARSAEVQSVINSGTARNVWDVASKLTWSRGFDSLGSFALRLAMAETASHLVYLQSQGAGLDFQITEVPEALVTGAE
ncbi:MBL fold metallo-hydrolase [Pseudarthrobacter sp. J1738]|uniref:MBL fold metallo-hydrolase n=1 Tax=Pseudarthrobacter sp. J1738 TaxID=3420446 RepID=UPI003D2B89DC